MKDNLRKNQCSVCREEIIEGAKKCTHCNSFLDWRSWLGMSQTTLALLVALVSVVTASAPALEGLFGSDHSDLQFSVRQVFSQNLELAVVNRGNKAGEFLSARLEATAKQGTDPNPIELGTAGAPSVFEQANSLFGLSIPPSLVPIFLAWPHGDIEEVKVVVRVREYGKDTEERTLQLPRSQYQLFCRATEDLDIVSRQRDAEEIDARLKSRCTM